MPIVRWDPFGDMIRLNREFNRLWPSEKEEMVSWAPRTDIKETDKDIMVRMDVPGMKMEDIDVSVDNDMLTISGERKMEKEEKGKDFVRMERGYGSFCRSFYLGIPVKESEVKASYKNGVLEISLPKAEVKKAKKIKIEGGK